jgi:hypothetical protein
LKILSLKRVSLERATGVRLDPRSRRTAVVASPQASPTAAFTQARRLIDAATTRKPEGALSFTAEGNPASRIAGQE